MAGRLKRQWRKRIREGLNHKHTEIFIAIMIVLSVVLVLVELSMVPSHPMHAKIELINDLLTYLFIGELTLHYLVEQRKLRFLKKYWVDILAVIPLFRSFRIFRVFRLLRLFRFGVIMNRRLMRFSPMFRYIKAEYIFISLSIVVMVLMGAFSMRMAEGRTNPDFATLEQALWFSMMSLIGGEPINGNPQTRLGLLVTTVLMLGGLTIFAIFAGTVSAVMVNSLRNIKIRKVELEDLEGHVVICGWNRAGRLLLDELLLDKKRFKHFVVLCEDDRLQDDPHFMSLVDEVFFLKGDYTRMELLDRAGIKRASYAMLLADSTKEERSSQDRDARTVLAAMLIEKMNKGIYTVVQLLNRDNEASLRELKVEEIIVSDEYVGNIMATVAKNRGIVNVLDELLTSKYGHEFFKQPMPALLVGKTVLEAIAILKLHHDATLIGVDLHTGDGHHGVEVNPPADLVLLATHDLIIAAKQPIS